MKAPIVILCLIGAAFANPIFSNVLLDSNSPENDSTMSLSASHSSENDTAAGLQNLKDNSSSLSSESSESLESNSEDKTSEESESHSLEDMNALIDETRDNNSEEEMNVRKSWLSVFASVVHPVSAEDTHSSTEVKGQPVVIPPSPTSPTPSMAPVNKALLVQVVGPTAAGDSSESSESPDNTNRLVGVTEASNNSSSSSSSSSESSESSQSKSRESSESSQSSESQSESKSSESKSSESSESSESNESSHSKLSSESMESNETSSASSDSSEGSRTEEDSNSQTQIKSKNCPPGDKSSECESEEEYFFQDIGDDAAQYPVGHFRAPTDNHLLEFIWRR